MAKITQGGTYDMGKEVLTFPRYDRIKLLSTTLKHILFDKKIGEERAGATLTRADTNMEKGGEVPNVMKWEIHEIWLQYQAIAIRSDAEMQLINDVVRGGVMDIDIVAKFTTLDVSLWMFEGAKQIVHVPTVAGDNVPPGTRGNYTAKLQLDVPIILEANTTFKQNLELAVSGAGLDGDYLAFVWWIKQFIAPPAARSDGA